MNRECPGHTVAHENLLTDAVMVDEQPTDTYVFSRENRFAPERNDLPVTGLSQKFALVAAVLLALFVVGGGAAPAAAHGSHAHRVTTERQPASLGSQPSEIRRGYLMRGTNVHMASTFDVSRQAPEKSGSADCCCGSVACHASMTLTVAFLSLPYAWGEKVVPEPSSNREQRVPSGLERPPRSLRSA